MPSEAEIYSDLTRIFRDVFLRDDLTPTANMTSRDVRGWDSSRHIEILMACEQRWNIGFTSREIDDLSSVGDLVRSIARKTARG
jgi:acyl carrier protein